ncbi:MAG TPA: TIGR04551 family protein [Pseudomonadota bacterium]|nr:TIGR04551 family protein [Pseudomonadota bacterium]
MRRSVPALSWLCLSAVATLSTLLLSGMGSKAWAQFGPGGGMRPMGGGAGGMGGPGGMGGGPPGDKPEGPAEAAPGQAAVDIATESLPDWPQKKDRAFQPFTLNGYLRGRGFYWHNFNLGHFNDPTKLANPFGAPYSEIPDAMGAPGAASCAVRSGAADCREEGIRTADMRFRLEPTLHISEYVRVKGQIDIFDNLILGSTPEGFYINGRGGAADGYPTIFSRGQVAEESAINAIQSSIRAKRAWGEIKTSLVEIAFGRMPFMWGTGMLFHDGNCPDCDFGTTVDRVMLTASAFDHFASISWDWAASGPTSAIVRNQMLTGWNYNIDNVDDVMQWTLLLGRKDDEQVIADRLRRGKVVVNYGALVLARVQGWDLTYNPRPQTTPTTMVGPDTPEYYPVKELQKSLGHRDAWSLTTDIWARLQWRKLYLEIEGAGVFGNIGEIDVFSDGGYGGDTAGRKATMQIQQFGGVLRGNYKFLKDQLIVGLEVGSASGPQNGDPRGELNWRRAREKPDGQVTSNGLIGLNSSRFTFDPDYHVDMILFRRILGTVYNATYMKPTVAYWLLPDTFGAQADFIYSLANRPATFPGHNVNVGAEINLRIMYQNKDEGFYTSLEYGVLFDLGALSQRNDIWEGTRRSDGTTAQAFQAKVRVKF